MLRGLSGHLTVLLPSAGAPLHLRGGHSFFRVSELGFCRVFATGDQCCKMVVGYTHVAILYGLIASSSIDPWKVRQKWYEEISFTGS